jgi:hypothetical protein
MRQAVLGIHGLLPVIHTAVVVGPADISAEPGAVVTEPILQVTQVLQLE